MASLGCSRNGEDSIQVDDMTGKPLTLSDKCEEMHIPDQFILDVSGPSSLEKCEHQLSNIDESINLRTGGTPIDSDSGISTDLGCQMLEELHTELRDKRATERRLRVKMDEQEREYEDQLAEVTAERDRLRSQLQLAREEMAGLRAENEEVAEKLSAAETVVGSERREHESLRRQLRTSQRAADMLETEKSTLQALLAKSKEECHRTYNTYAARQTTLLEENEALKSKLADLNTKLQEQEELLDQTLREKASLEKEMVDVMNRSVRDRVRSPPSVETSFDISCDQYMLRALDSLNLNTTGEESSRDFTRVSDFKVERGRPSLFDELLRVDSFNRFLPFDTSHGNDVKEATKHNADSNEIIKSPRCSEGTFENNSNTTQNDYGTRENDYNAPQNSYGRSQNDCDQSQKDCNQSRNDSEKFLNDYENYQNDNEKHQNNNNEYESKYSDRTNRSIQSAQECSENVLARESDISEISSGLNEGSDRAMDTTYNRNGVRATKETRSGDSLFNENLNSTRENFNLTFVDISTDYLVPDECFNCVQKNIRIRQLEKSVSCTEKPPNNENSSHRAEQIGSGDSFIDEILDSTRDKFNPTFVDISTDNLVPDECFNCVQKIMRIRELENSVRCTERALKDAQNELAHYEQNLTVLQKNFDMIEEKNARSQTAIDMMRKKIETLESPFEKSPIKKQSYGTDTRKSDTSSTVGTQTNEAPPKKSKIRNFLWDTFRGVLQLFAVLCLCAGLIFLYGVMQYHYASRHCVRNNARVPWSWLSVADILDLLFHVETIGEIPM